MRTSFPFLRAVVTAGIVLTVVPGAAQAQYEPVSPYLANPAAVIGYVDSCASFWLRAYDTVYGGFYTNVDRTGNVITSWGTNKNVLSQSRDAYGFCRAYMMTGNPVYLAMARNALDFMEQFAWDGGRGGWYHSNARNGAPINPTDTKTAFDQHYALLGISAYYEATRDETEWSRLMTGYSSNEAHLWDTSAARQGYFDHAAYDWSSPAAKSFNATVDAITTHMLSLYLLTGQETYKARLLQLGANILDHLVQSMDQQAIGFVETYYSDWSPDDRDSMTIMGHVLKTGWCLGRLYELFPDSSYLNAAEKLVSAVLAKGYDHDLGGPYKDYNRFNGRMLMWGQADTAKAWWQMEQAVTSGLLLYEITGKTEYVQMADETLDFFMRYFVDHQYGEVYSDRTRYGAQIWGNEKGNSGKAGYHSIELGYYVYLYATLFLRHQPVTLFYNIVPDTSDRILLMNPLAWETTKYGIGDVVLNDTSYHAFDAAARTIHLAPGTGGRMAVTYQPSGATTVSEPRLNAASFALGQNYPNPFNPSTTLSFTLKTPSHVTLKVYDLLGREVATLVNERLQSGTYARRWDAGGVSGGVYYYRLTAGASSQTRSMLLIR